MAEQRFGGALGALQALDDPEEYYEVMKRPLNMLGGGLLYLLNPELFSHWHLWASNGENIGLGDEGLFSENKTARAQAAPVEKYRGLRIPKKVMDEVLNKEKQRWDAAEDYLSSHPEIDLDGFDPERDRYGFYVNNCKHYVNDMVNRAANIDQSAFRGNSGGWSRW